MADKSALKKIIIIVPIVLALLVVGAFAAMNLLGEKAGQETVPENIEPAADDGVTAEEEADDGDEPIAEPEDAAQAEEQAVVPLSDDEVQAALKERTLGNPDAALVITEHSSLTCGHCGAFHKDVFKKIKAEYLDTGKAYLVFSDFPLNRPALEASMAARCLPEDRYFDYIQLLFESQDQWAYSQDYRKFLKQNAQLAGLSGDKFESCIASTALQEGLAKDMQAAQEKHSISSTPSFVLNDKEVLTGGRSYEDFQKAFDKYLSESE